MYHKIVANQGQNFRYICIGINLNKNYLNLQEISDFSEREHFVVKDEGTVRILYELFKK